MIDIEQTPEQIRDGPSAAPLPCPPRALACRNLSFGYGSEDCVLRRIDFQARAGERVAVIGESGTGKSSSLQLIPCLCDARKGTLTIGDRDVRAVQLRSLCRAIIVVPQNPILFQGTLRQNLRYGRPSATAAEIEHAAWTACLTEVVDRLPRGWETELGPLAAGLSGGERQRVAIARALLQDAPILIHDALYRSDILYRALWPHADAASTERAEAQDQA